MTGTAPAGAFGLVIFLSTLKLWLPSVSFIYGRVGSTPALELAGFALIPFALVVVGVLIVPLRHAARLAIWAGALLASWRVVLQATDGGDPQLWLSTLGLLAGLVFLVALVAHGTGRGLGLGLVLGLAADATLEVVLGGADPLWYDGVAAWVVVGLLAAGLLLALSGLRSEPAPVASAAWPWVALGPLLVLHGIVTGAPTRLAAITSWHVGAVALVVVGSHVAAVLFALALRPARRRWAAVTGVVGGALLAVTPSVISSVVGLVLLTLGVAAAVLAVDGADGRSTPKQRGVATAWGMLVLFVLVFLYYASYDLALGIRNSALLGAAGLIAAGYALRTRPATGAGAPRPMAAGVAAGTALAVAAAGVVSLGAPSVATSVGDGFPVRVMTYNVHMGYDVEGRFVADELAGVITSQDPDIVVLNEVDRGWLLNGSNDVLAAIAARAGYDWVFAPAADAIWGNAILSRYPLHDVRVVELPRGGAPMRRSVISAVADLGGGTRLGVVGTHLHHRDEDADIRAEQAAAVAAVVDRLAATTPVVLMGDLNAAPTDRELAPLSALTDVVTPAGEVATYPSWDPAEHIDHVLVTPSLAGRDVAVPVSTASDHLGVAVTLEPR